MDASILTSIKKLLGIGEDFTHFDTDIIIHINSIFLILNQIGVGPNTPFSIIDDTAKWSDFSDDSKIIEAVKTYVYLRVRIIFDPPTNGTIMEAMNKQIQEFEWRLNLIHESGDEIG